jgi:filamentous hemagglutinin
MKTFREKNKFNRVMLWITLFSFVTQPLIVSAQTIADSSDGTATPVIDQTVNGTDLVHIARPHTDGVSHNLYLEFNVSSNGLILNNNATNAAVSTSQGEGVIPNFNFQGGNAASVILNEVTGGNLSTLLGDLEIAGAGAELIIANENGITCNGCGFINSTQTTLTTGKTIFDNSGNLTAFRVTDGIIDIGTEGLDASLSQSLNLLANGINVDGPVWANNLQAVAGQNNIDSETLSNTAIAGTASTTPLIDIGSLGGMYAKQIFLVTTGAGTGVNNSGKIGASVGDLIITSDGKLKSKGSMSAQSSMTLNTSEIDNQGSISSRTNMSLQANTVDNMGNITSLANIALNTSRLNNEGILSSKGRTDIEATGSVSNVGEISSDSTMNISALSIDNTGAINVENGGLTLNSQQHINNTDTAKIVVASGNVAITDATQLNNDGIISLGAGNLTINSGQVNNTSEINLESGDLNIAIEDYLHNAGRINLEAGDLSITSQQHMDNSGKINVKAGDATITAQQYLNNSGEIISDTGAIDISATELINAGNISSQENQSITADVNNTGLITSNKKLTITTLGELSNNGTIGSVELLDITSGIVHNAVNGRILAQNIFNITATDIYNQNMISFFGGQWDTQTWSNERDIQNKDNAFVLNSVSLDNSGTINNINSDFTATSDTTLVNSGTIKSDGNLSLQATNDIDNTGKIVSNGILSISTQGNISNTPKNNTVDAIIEAVDITLTGAEIVNDSIIKSANDITINATQQFNNNDQLTLVGDLIIDTNIFNNLGLANISAGKGMTVNSNTFLNAADAAILTGTGDLNISTASLNNNSFDNNGRIETQNGNMKILVNGNTTQDGELISAADLYFFSGLTDFNVVNGNVITTGQAGRAGSLFNSGIIQSGSNLKLGFSSIINNKTISSNDSLSAIYSLGNITNRKDIYGKSGLSIISHGTLNNTNDAAITSLNTLTIDVANNINNSGFIIGNAKLDIDANKLENIDGFISGGLVNVDVNTLKNDASSGMFSTKKMDIQSGSGGVDNYGEIYSFLDLDITLDTWGTIYNRQNASIKSKGNMLLGVDCVGPLPCNPSYQTTFDNSSLVQADLSIELNSYTFLNQIANPTLGDWRVTDSKYKDQNHSGRYGSCGFLQACETYNWGYSYYLIGEGYSDWLKDITEVRTIDYSLIQSWPMISAGQNLTLSTNNGENKGGIIEAHNTLTLRDLDSRFASAFTNTTITTRETKKSYQEGRDEFDCPLSGSCKFVKSHGGGLKEINTTATKEGGIIRANSINVTIGNLLNENGATSDTKPTDTYNGVSKNNNTHPPASPANFVGIDALKIYIESVPYLAPLPNEVQSVSSAIGIDVNGGNSSSNNGLFVESSAPDREFLYVLNPRIPTDNSTQVGTDYLLQKMGVDIGNILRLGDASYEQQIIEQQIAMQASSRWITDAETAGEQLTILMDNGVEFADTNGLLVGESLTDEQILNLEKDLVWLEYSYLSGEIVLIPVVYLTQETKKHSAGAILAETIQLDVGTLGNHGGTIAATGDATIIAQGDIENIGGTITADNLAIVSTEGSIINESVIRRVGTEDNYVETATEALISANNDLILSANQNIEILGATVEAGNSAVVHTENGDVNVTSLVLESKTTTESHTQTGWFSSEHTKTVTTEQTQQTAGINVGGNLNGEGAEQNSDQNQGGLLIYAANGAVNLTGADISSTDDIAIFADDVVTSTLALYNFTTTETHSSGFAIGGGGIGVYSNDSLSESAATTASGTSISAGGNLLVDATNDIILEGGSINAQTGAFNAGNNFTTLAAADTSSTRESSSQSQAGIQVGGGGISGSASTTTSSASSDSTLYSNVDMQFEDGVSITARDTVDIGGLDLAVINVAEVVEPEPEADAENTELVENAEQPEPETSELAEVDEATDSSIADMRSHLNITSLVAEIVSGTSDISTVASLTSEAIQDLQPEIALGSATITGDKVISTKFENTYNETSSTSTTSVGFSAGASDNGDGTSSVNASIGGGTSSASGSTDILAENMNTISAGDLTISGTQSVDLVGVDLSGQDSVTLTSEGDINITAAKYNQSTASSSSDTSFGISAGISVRNGEEPDENTPENAIKPVASASLGFAYNDSNEQSSATSLGHVDSVILSQGNVTIQSGDGDIEFKGVSVVSDSTTIEGNSFSSAAFEDSFTSDESSSQTGVSFTASTDIVEMGKSIFEGNGAQSLDVDAYGSQEVGNTLISNNLTIDVNNDVTIVGGDISAGQINIAANTVDIKAAQSVYHEERVESKVSLGGDVRASLGGESVHASYDTIDGGKSDSSSNNDPVEPGQGHNGKAVSSEVVGADMGLTIKNTETTTDSTTYQNANIQFTDLVIDTTDKTDTGRGDGYVDIGGANLLGLTSEVGEEPVSSSIAITTGEVKTTKFVDTTTTTVHDTSTFIGYTAEGHSAVADMYNHEEALQAKQAEGMTIDEGLHAAQLAADTTNLAMGDLAGGTAGAAIRHNTTDSTSTSTSENINYLNANNISITTTEGNIDLKGVEFNAPPSMDETSGETVASTQPRIESIALNSAQDVNITAAKSTFTETSTTTSHNLNASGYASASAMGSSVGLDVGYNGNTETNTLDQTTYSNAQMNADNITITGQNLSLTGANVSGGNVNLDLDNNINITSVQDTQSKTTTRANWGGSVGASAGTYGLAPSVNVQGGGGDSHDNHALTKQQSGIQAENNLTVQAGGDLNLTGAHVGVDEGGSGSVDVAGNLVSNKLDDYRDQAGLFGGGGGGFDAGGINANVNLEVVDKIDQQTTQNSTISGVELTVAGTTSGDNLNNGQLQTEQTTIVKDEKIAGIMIVASGFAPKPNKKGAASGGPVATMPTNTKGQQKNKIVTDAANAIAAKPPKQANGNKTTESVVVVIPANKNGTQQDNVVQTAADAVANKQTDKDRNVVVVKENQDGSLQVVKGDMETVTGNTKIDVVSHGNNLKDSGAESVATLIKKVADESGLTDSNKNSELTNVNLTACGDCNKTGGKTIGEQLTTQLANNGMAPKVKEHNSKIQVTDSGNVIAFNDKNATTLTHQIENGKLTTAVKAEKNLSDTPLKNTLDGDDTGAAPKSATENLSDKTKSMRPTEDVKALANATSEKANKDTYSPDADYSKLEKDRMSGSRSLQKTFFNPKPEAKQQNWRDTNAIALKGASDIGLKATPDQLNTLIIALNTKATEGTAKAGKIRKEDRGGGLLPSEHISPELSNFTTWLSGALTKVEAGVADPVIVAAKAGQRLNTIHPFGDGNGRAVNLTIDFILLSSGLPPSSSGLPPAHVDTSSSGTKQENQLALDTAVKHVRNGVEKSIAILEKQAADAAAVIAKLSEDGNDNNKGHDGKVGDDKSDDGKDGHTKTSTESVIVVIPANKDGKSPDAVVQNAADAVAKKQADKDRNVVVVKEKKDGSLEVIQGDMSKVKGNTKIDVVSHGNNLKDSGAESVATLIVKVADESGLTDSNKNSELTKVNLTACGDCNKTGGKTIGEQVTTQLANNGIAPKVKEHNSKIQVTDSGNVIAFNDKNAITITHQIENGKLTTAVKAEKNLSDTQLKNTLDGDDAGAAPKTATENLSDKTKSMRPTEEVKAFANATSQKADKGKYSPEANYSNLDAARMSGSRSLQMPKEGSLAARRMDPDQKQAITDKQTQWRETEVIARQTASEVGLKAKPGDLNNLILALNAKATEGTAKAGKIRNEERGGGLLPPEHISPELSNFTKWLSGALAKVDAGVADPVIVAAKAGQRLNTIHPFGDGNGRVVNLTIDFILLSSGLPPSSAGHPPKHVDTEQTGTPEQNQAALDTAVAAVRDGVEKSIATLAAAAKLAEDGHTKTATDSVKKDDALVKLQTEQQAKDNNSQYDSNIIVVTRGKDGDIDQAVMDSANELASKHPDNTKVVIESADGKGYQGDVSSLSGKVRVNIVGHGDDVRAKDVKQVSNLVAKLSKDMNAKGEEASLQRVGLVACGNCLKTGDSSYGQTLAKALQKHDLTPEVAERTSKLQVNKDGTKSSFSPEGNTSKKLVHKMEGDKLVTTESDVKRVLDTDENSRLLDGDAKNTDAKFVKTLPKAEKLPHLAQVVLSLRPSEDNKRERKKNYQGLADESLASMFFNGDGWVDSSVNLRSQKKADSATNPEHILGLKDRDLPEAVMKAFRDNIENGVETPALKAVQGVSAENIETLTSRLEYSPTETELAFLKGFSQLDFSVTHFANQARSYRTEGDNVTTMIHSRQKLDSNAPELGVKDYPISNTPSLSQKRVGHTDNVFFALEPRAPGKVTVPFKTTSRFVGDESDTGIVHTDDIANLPAVSWVAVGDLALKEVTIKAAALNHRFGTFIKDQSIEFTSLSEMIFTIKDMKQGLAYLLLNKLRDLDPSGGIIEQIKTPEDFNFLISSILRPEVMVPGHYVSDTAQLFEARGVAAPASASTGKSAATSKKVTKASTGRSTSASKKVTKEKDSA